MPRNVPHPSILHHVTCIKLTKIQFTAKIHDYGFSMKVVCGLNFVLQLLNKKTEVEHKICCIEITQKISDTLLV